MDSIQSFLDQHLPKLVAQFEEKQKPKGADLFSETISNPAEKEKRKDPPDSQYRPPISEGGIGNFSKSPISPSSMLSSFSLDPLNVGPPSRKRARLTEEVVHDHHLEDLIKEGRINPEIEMIDLSSAKNLSDEAIYLLFCHLKKLSHVKLFDMSEQIYRNLANLVLALPNLDILECPLNALSHLDQKIFFDHFFDSFDFRPKTLRLHWVENSQDSIHSSWGEYFQMICQKNRNRRIEVFIDNNKLFFSYWQTLIILTSEGVRNTNPDRYLTPLKKITETLLVSLDLDYLTDDSQNKNFEHWKIGFEYLSKQFPNLDQIHLPITKEVLINRELSFECLFEMNIKEIILKIKADTFFPKALVNQSPLIEMIRRKALPVCIFEVMELSEEGWNKSSEEEKEGIFLQHIQFGLHYMKLFKTYHLFKSFSPLLGHLNAMMEDVDLKRLKPENFAGTHLVLANLKKITDEGLIFFFSGFQSLSSIDLRGCSSLTFESILMLKEKYPNIAIFPPGHLEDPTVLDRTLRQGWAL